MQRLAESSIPRNFYAVVTLYLIAGSISFAQPISRTSDGKTLAAAADLAKQKHELEREIEKVKIDITYRERAVRDEHLVAKSLLDFEKTTARISFDEPCAFCGCTCVRFELTGLTRTRNRFREVCIPEAPKYEPSGLR